MEANLVCGGGFYCRVGANGKGQWTGKVVLGNRGPLMAVRDPLGKTLPNTQQSSHCSEINHKLSSGC